MNTNCNLFIVRHGQTEWNAQGIWQGQQDSILTMLGEEQARSLSEKLKDIRFEAVYASDLIRAKRTAEIIVAEKKLAVQTTEALRERAAGILEGKKSREVKAELKQLFDLFDSLPEEDKKTFKIVEGWETDEQLMSRFITFLREVAVAYPDKNVLIVTHGAVIRTFLIHLGFGTHKELQSGAVKNTAYITVQSDGINFNLIDTYGVEKSAPEGAE